MALSGEGTKAGLLGLPSLGLALGSPQPPTKQLQARSVSSVLKESLETGRTGASLCPLEHRGSCASGKRCEAITPGCSGSYQGEPGLTLGPGLTQHLHCLTSTYWLPKNLLWLLLCLLCVLTTCSLFIAFKPCHK